MKIPSLPAVVFLIACAASLPLGSCASKNQSGGGAIPPGYHGGTGTYSPMPMNQAARTDAMRQQYRNEFR